MQPWARSQRFSFIFSAIIVPLPRCQPAWQMAKAEAQTQESWWHRVKAFTPESQVKHDRALSPHGWLTITCKVLCLPLRFHQSSILCRLSESPLDETINWGRLGVYACKKITNPLSRYYSPCLVNYGNTKITYEASTEVSESSNCWSLTLNGRKTMKNKHPPIQQMQQRLQ